MKKYRLVNNLLGWLAFAVSAIVYIMTLEPTASFWDCGEFISSAYKLEIGHPPGNPIFMLTGRFFANFASSPAQVAFMVNLMSALLSAGTILFLFWTISRLARKIVVKEGEHITKAQAIGVWGAAMVGALVYAFSDTFWFSAVEGEVYAYSSFCTAIVFWLILKWEEIADEPHADRYIILIAYLMGISIGVHLLNLLCIPAIVLVYYYKKSPHATAKGSIMALALSFVIIFFLLYGLIPGFVKVAGWAELFFVNTLGMPYNSGVIIYFFLVLAMIAWGIYETMTQKSEIRIKISFIIALSLMGVPFLGSSVWLGILLIAVLTAFLFIRKKLALHTLNTILVGLMVIFVGYSSYALIMIRSSAQPPMNQNDPEDIFSLGSYLNREQYGDRPLLYGYTFVSDVQRDSEGRPVSKAGNALWSRVIKSDAQQKDKYIVTGYKEDYVYNPDLDMLFPRMYSRQPSHISAYKEWTNFKGTPVRTQVNGEMQTVYKPTFGENIKYFLSYQLNFMYWRYFMWNFSGRQNDQQGNGEIQNGNWLTGFNFIDKYIAGDQTTLSPEMAANKGRNRYFMLPLLLGIAGLLFQAYSGKKGIESFWVTFFLFFMTGIAIVIYLNQTPYQPRERDYAYAGSFYAFSIWVGLGVLAVVKGFQRFLPPKVAAALAAVICLAVPVEMIAQNWDDHDRSNRYAARDFGMNYLSCVDENGIIFTNGDNDTFPLWYVQETEGYRTDVRVCNLSYLQIDWYMDQMKSQAYTSAPLPIAQTRLEYAQGKRNAAYLVDITKKPVALNTAMEWLLSEDERTKSMSGYQERIDYLPAEEFFLPINKKEILASGIISEADSAKIVPQMNISLKNKNVLYKNEIAILDMINTNNKEGWKRPIYFAVTVDNDMYMNLGKYFSLTGLAYQLVPIEGAEGGTINTAKMYDNMMHKFKWGGVDTQGVYLDENIRRMCRTMRLMFARLIDSLIVEGKPEQALTALNYCMEKIPGSNVPHDYISMMFGEDYFALGDKVKAKELLNGIAANSAANLRWYFSLMPNQLRTVMSDAGHNLSVLQNIVETYKTNGETADAAKWNKEFDFYLKRWNALQR